MNRQMRPPGPPDRPDWCVVTAYGSTLPGIELYAVDHAMRFYGTAARMRVEQVGQITEAKSPRAPGKWMADVVLRCLNHDEAVEAQRAHVAEVSTARTLTEIADFLDAVGGDAYDPDAHYGGLPEVVHRWTI